MRFLARIIVSIIGNCLGLYLAWRFVPGFNIETGHLPEFALVALALAFLNVFVKPVLKLLFGPVIVITLGLGLLLVNAIVLALLDFLTQNLTILSIPALIYGSLIIGAVNFLFQLALKK